MRLAFLIFVLSLNSFAGIFPSKIERLSKKFFVKKLDVDTKIVINPEVITNKNVCVKDQLKLWLKEFKGMDSNTQSEVKSFFTHLNQVTINEPVMSGEFLDVLYNLRYERCYMNSFGGVYGMGYPRQDCDVFIKQIGKTLNATSIGSLPVTNISVSNMNLDFNMEFSKHHVRTITMNTNSFKVYKEVDSRDSDIYKNYVKDGRIKEWSDKEKITPDCDFKTLKYLITIH